MTAEMSPYYLVPIVVCIWGGGGESVGGGILQLRMADAKSATQYICKDFPHAQRPHICIAVTRKGVYIIFFSHNTEQVL